jgi:hypothetical protein
MRRDNTTECMTNYLLECWYLGYTLIHKVTSFVFPKIILCLVHTVKARCQTAISRNLVVMLVRHWLPLKSKIGYLGGGYLAEEQKCISTNLSCSNMYHIKWSRALHCNCAFWVIFFFVSRKLEKP